MCAWEFTKKCDSEEVVRIWGIHHLSKECGGAEWHFWKEKKMAFRKNKWAFRRTDQKYDSFMMMSVQVISYLNADLGVDFSLLVKGD